MRRTIAQPENHWYNQDMKISQTIIATDSDGNSLVPLVQPVVQSWGSTYDDIGIMVAVAQMLQSARDQKFVKTLAIHIEL